MDKIWSLLVVFRENSGIFSLLPSREDLAFILQPELRRIAQSSPFSASLLRGEGAYTIEEIPSSLSLHNLG